MLEDLLSEIRLSIRNLRQAPVFTGVAILTIALALSATFAVLTVLNALAFRKLPVPDPASLVAISGRTPSDALRLTLIPVVDELLREPSPIQHPCGYNGGLALAVEVERQPTQAMTALVTGRCFRAFGVLPILGRTIDERDAPLLTPGSRVVVVGHRFWRQMLGADVNAIGRTIQAEGITLTVIGVLPDRFGGLDVDNGVDLFVPFDTISPARPDRRPGATHIVGRLRSSWAMASAQAHLTARWPSILESVVPATLPPRERAALLDARPRLERMSTGLSLYRIRYGRPLNIVLTLALLLLLVAVANLSALFLSRLDAHRQEYGIQWALGASRSRVLRPIVIEAGLVTSGAAAIAIPLSTLLSIPLVSLLPTGTVEPALDFSPDGRMVAIAVIAAAVVALLVSAVPAAVALRQRTAQWRHSERVVARTISRSARSLLVGQQALALVIAVGAMLLARSVYELQAADLGVRADGVLSVRVLPVPNAYRDIDNTSYYPALVDDLRGIPGVRSVGFSRMFPRLVAEATGQPVSSRGEHVDGAWAVLESVSPGFFETLGIGLIAGRDFTWQDRATSIPVAIISESLARALGQGESAIGKQLTYGSDRAHDNVVVVGIVRNSTLGNPRQADLPIFYRPALQSGGLANFPTLAVAFNRDADLTAIADRVTRTLRGHGREYAHSVNSLSNVLASAPRSERLAAGVATPLALMAVLLAYVGTYGLLSYTVSQRAKEIAVRIALGANPAIIVGMVLGDALRIVITGVAIGIPAALAATTVLQSLMFGVSRFDFLSYVLTTGAIVAVSVGAALIPAGRALSISPSESLKLA